MVREEHLMNLRSVVVYQLGMRTNLVSVVSDERRNVFLRYEQHEKSGIIVVRSFIRVIYVLVVLVGHSLD